VPAGTTSADLSHPPARITTRTGAPAPGHATFTQPTLRTGCRYFPNWLRHRVEVIIWTLKN
jgi:hypothetical protein